MSTSVVISYRKTRKRIEKMSLSMQNATNRNVQLDTVNGVLNNIGPIITQIFHSTIDGYK